MANMSVTFDRLNEQAGQFSRYALTLGRCEVELESVRAKLGLISGFKTDAVSQLKSVRSQLSDQVHATAKMGRTLNSVGQIYRNTENRLDAKASIGFEFKDFLKLVGSFGFVGGLVSTIGSYGNNINVGKWLFKLLGSGAKIVEKGTKATWKDYLGFNVGPKVKGFKANWAKEVDKYKWTPGKGHDAKNVGTIAKWAGVALTAVASFIGNYEEYGGDLKNKRLWEETVVETAVDVGKGMLIAAGVGAAAVAVGVSAPAWAVAGVATVVSIGLDYVCEDITGQGLTEHISDHFLDTGEKIKDAVADISDSVADAVGGGVKAIKKGFSSMWKKAFA